MRAAHADPLHGYSLADLDRIAGQALTRGYGWRAGDIEERHAVARLAVVEHLYAAQEQPTRYDLVRAAMAADHRHVTAELREYGVGRPERGQERAPNFERYWWSAAANAPSPESGIVERLAVWQILPLLSDRQRDAVVALAARGDYEAAGAALGLKPSALDARLAGARRAFAAAWHEGETPRRVLSRDRRIWSRSGAGPDGRARLTVSQVEAVRARKAAGESVREMAAELGVSKKTLYALLRGAHRPAPDPAAAQ